MLIEYARMRIRCWRALDADQVIKRTFDSIRRRVGHSIVDFSKDVTFKAYGGARAVLRDDSDDHRTRVGYMIYPSAIVCTVGETDWLLAIGRKGGDYPGQQYRSDLIAIPFLLPTGSGKNKPKSSVLLQLAELIGRKSRYLESSLFCVMWEGAIIIQNEELKEDIGSIMGGPYVLSVSEMERTRRGQIYTHDSPKFLADGILDYLAWKSGYLTM